MQPGGLQRRHQRPDFRGQQLHQDDADHGQRHGDAADDLDSEFLFRHQGKQGDGPDEAQQHLVDAGERRTARKIPAMRDGQRVGYKTYDGSGGCELHVACCTGDAEAHIERACRSVEDERYIEKIALAEQVAAGFGRPQQRHDEQKRY